MATRTFSRKLPFEYSCHTVKRHYDAASATWTFESTPLQAGTPCRACSRDLRRFAYRLLEPYVVPVDYEGEDGQRVCYTKSCGMNSLLCYGCANNIAQTLEK